jgi:ATP-binding cassette subfamily C protein EexD
MTNFKQEAIRSELKEAIYQSKRSFIIAGFFSLFINLLMLVPPLYMLQLYDRVITSRSESTLVLLTLIVIFAFITMALLEIVRSKILVRVGNKLDSILSQRVFDSLFELANKHPGRANSMPLNDLTTLRQFMTGNGLFAFFDAPWIPIYIYVLYIFHPSFAYFAIFAAIVLIIFTIVNEYSTKDQLNQANSYSRASMAYVDSNLRNAEVINVLGMKEDVRQKWEDKYFRFLNAQSDASNRAGVWTNISKSTRMLFQSLMLGLGGYLAIKMEVSAGMMIAGSIIMSRALAPLDLIISSWKGFNSARTSYSRLDSLLSDFPKDKEYMSLPDPTGEVSLESVTVVPPLATEPSVRGVSMKIDKGDVVGIIGPSAAGKSSLARAMLGLWPLLGGKVRLDGADIHQWDKSELGRHIGYLPQDIELFEGSISQNISRFSKIDPNKVVAAAKEAGVHEMILRLPDGYDTIIGPGGVSLSGGQRQRIGFARAIYDTPIFVVLDEPNSNLDEVGELALVEAVKSLKNKGITVVIITHRTNILQATSKIAVLAAGVLTMYGPTTEVLAKLKSVNSSSNSMLTKATPKISLSKPGS